MKIFNNVRIAGFLLLLISIGLHYFFENEGYDFLIGAAGGAGGGLVLVGRIKSRRKDNI